ncbi:MAG: acyl-CoA reductase [Bacteroidia bacterium]|jgi:hypothetical protein|nr:acyl-CoA reductase [Bacteroidia bacterium]
MNFQQAIQTYKQLGLFFKQAAAEDLSVFHQAYVTNNWFTVDYIKNALHAWSEELTESSLTNWFSAYTEPHTQQKKVAIIMAGNIPFVGLHDLLCVLATGHSALVKLSSDDYVLMKWVIDALIDINPSLANDITVAEGMLPKGFDAVIATGSNNTNRYFEAYFKGVPSLLRKSRSSVAVLTGNETPEDIQLIGKDIFTYFGLGCRNVSKIYVPEGYDLTFFLDHIQSFYSHIDHHKYANNYTYHKAILLMNLTPHLDNNFLLVKEDTHLASPLSVLFWESYKNETDLMYKLSLKQDEIQCVVSKIKIGDSVPLGRAQYPAISGYADGIDTINFLLNI